jgi:hypothetical protein
MRPANAELKPNAPESPQSIPREPITSTKTIFEDEME